jgi:hypothetical protein
MNEMRPIQEVMDEYKETYSGGCGLIKIEL